MKYQLLYMPLPCQGPEHGPGANKDNLGTAGTCPHHHSDHDVGSRWQVMRANRSSKAMSTSAGAGSLSAAGALNTVPAAPSEHAAVQLVDGLKSSLPPMTRA